MVGILDIVGFFCRVAPSALTKLSNRLLLHRNVTDEFRRLCGLSLPVHENPSSLVEDSPVVAFICYLVLLHRLLSCNSKVSLLQPVRSAREVEDSLRCVEQPNEMHTGWFAPSCM